ncbi:cell division cycle 5-like protein [Euphorbia lathyris]|uniref:cell division cycle 5-like protein n=1 Tax=Euphorbia lathyris TaxID=212925 RepID=UPI0033143264
MRIMIKGGVWKNTEDEILKAAVMKYGKNQWARISSLLVRKSAKQCKARWYEWLDPSIKKTEWTREEDEKLLHLAKLMPTQWRTIAPIVGRTPSQCLERYEKLLDAACTTKDDNYEAGDDPRKLRPGEIDPNPESKPARPDPVDMDEDEKEMLSEARARLANTRGKKAKRKAREKQLEEARRLASLQKRRELKAAGIDNRHRKRKRKGIDYNAEIPFEKRPPPGFFDVADEDRPVEQPKFPITAEELEGKKRVDIEAQLRKQDVAKNKIAQRQDAPSAIIQANKLNDPETVRKRSKLMLPAPQISDHELEEIAKMGYASDLAGSEELTEGSGATRALLANYAQTPQQGMTPIRTPQRTPVGKGDAIMMEAENLARLRESQTPLLGGENPELHPSDFSGVTPKKKDILTPNPMLTPSATPGAAGLTPRIGMTPSRDGNSFGMTPKATPIRDELHINEDMDMHDNAKLEQRRQADLKKNLRTGLGNLPQPRNEYQIVIQPPQEDDEEPEEKIEEDMSDRIAREKAEEEARLQALLRKRSKVLQRELPRPPSSSLELIRNSLLRADGDKSSFVPPTSIELADEMIRKELLSLLEHDNAKYPLDEKMNKEKKKGAKRSANGSAASIPVIEDYGEDDLKEADNLIKEEAQYIRVAMGHESESIDEFVEAHKTCLNDLMYFPTRSAYGLSSVAGNVEKLAALQNEFEHVKTRLESEREKAFRLEKKVNVLTQGYQTRAERQLLPPIESILKQMETAGTELECFQALQKQEKSAASYRINGLWEEVQKQKELEQTLQRRFGNLVTELERVQLLVNDYRALAKQQEEIDAKNAALELAQTAVEQTAMLASDSSKAIPSEATESSVPVDSSSNEISEKQTSPTQDHATDCVEEGKDSHSEKEHGSMVTDTSVSNDVPSTEVGTEVTPVQISSSENDQQENTADVIVTETNKLDGNPADTAISVDDKQIGAEVTNLDDMSKCKNGEDERVNPTKDADGKDETVNPVKDAETTANS